MTYRELAEDTERLYPSEYEAEELIKWAREVDADVMDNIIKKQGTPGKLDDDDTVLINTPYDNLYRFYILAQISFFQRDWSAYSNYAALYTERFSEYAAYWQRTYGAECDKLTGWI